MIDGWSMGEKLEQWRGPIVPLIEYLPCARHCIPFLSISYINPARSAFIIPILHRKLQLSEMPKCTLPEGDSTAFEP